MIRKQDRRLRVGVLGCGPIAQFAHLESCTKARNADLYAICDTAPDLLARMQATHAPQKAFADYDMMLADPDLEAVIIATSDAWHVPMAIKALQAGKHVLCEKPIGVSVEEGQALADAVATSGCLLQVGHMKRFDPALEAARDFVQQDMGQVLALKAWYCDSTHRYTNTDAIQPLPVTSALARKPAGNPKADLRQYFMLAHGSHLVDTARFLCGEIVAVRARLLERFGAYCWFVETEFASGALGHLDLTVAVRMDWHEGFQLYGENGSVTAKIFNPWYFRAAEVEIFHESDATIRKPLGADGHFFRRQLEGLADAALTGAPLRGADVQDGIASIRAMVAIARSVESGGRVALASVTGAV
ncbi:Gfo/Idh/MocA family oxidoreductase [Fertoebacter nigrum]|uniref:Gfo/Idh/MocA family oxidoreductase n=1 Tax=Fertoeibacter niger TaxID=2656921 RepID=A0A8X8H0F3_9RHOB|nr:Gfo/Idh/MocA family oxidoreductase [Fertoeibacter niger]NUB45253.1 Gfo/Idh/MocA family oxidoreductase [Fertoeibacter niger]